MKCKRIAALLLAVLLAALSAAPALCVEPNRSFTYDEENRAVPSPNAFQVQQVIYGKDMPCGPFLSAQDMSTAATTGSCSSTPSTAISAS